jgi:protein-S-isoprenylcysteine O-methyltransferase Ste14
MEDNTLQPHKNKVHKVLIHSYSSFFFFFLIGVYLDLVFNLKVFESKIVEPIGLVFLILGTLLVFWAQKTSRNLKKEGITKETFARGPYRFNRSPTNLGLFFLVLGFGLIANAFFVILFSFVSLIVAKFIFLRKEEKILSEKYGAPYLEYKQSVKF